MVKKTVGYLCALYGGVIRLGFVRYVATDNVPEEELEKYKDLYGADLKARYVKVNESSTEAFDKLCTLLKTTSTHSAGNIYELNITRAVKLMKESSGCKKATTWNLGDEENKEEGDEEGENVEAEAEAAESVPAPTTTADSAKTKAKATAKTTATSSVPVPATPMAPTPTTPAPKVVVKKPTPASASTTPKVVVKGKATK